MMTQAELYTWYYYDIRWCGCGRPSDALELVKLGLEHYAFPGEPEGYGPRPEYHAWYKKREAWTKEHLGADERWHWFISYQLDVWGLTEHGGAVSSGWLTDKGKALLAALREHGTRPGAWSPPAIQTAPSLLEALQQWRQALFPALHSIRALSRS